jgi:hypothetical protein
MGASFARSAITIATPSVRGSSSGTGLRTRMSPCHGSIASSPSTTCPQRRRTSVRGQPVGLCHRSVSTPPPRSTPAAPGCDWTCSGSDGSARAATAALKSPDAMGTGAASQPATSRPAPVQPGSGFLVVPWSSSGLGSPASRPELSRQSFRATDVPDRAANRADPRSPAASDASATSAWPGPAHAPDG